MKVGVDEHYSSAAQALLNAQNTYPAGSTALLFVAKGDTSSCYTASQVRACMCVHVSELTELCLPCVVAAACLRHCGPHAPCHQCGHPGIVDNSGNIGLPKIPVLVRSLLLRRIPLTKVLPPPKYTDAYNTFPLTRRTQGRWAMGACPRSHIPAVSGLWWG